MPKEPAIPHAQMQEILLSKEGIIDDKGKVCGPSHAVWQDLSNTLFGVYTPNYIYVYVKSDRHNILTKILEKAGVDKPSNESEDSTEDEDDSVDENEEKRTCRRKKCGSELQPVKTFNVLVPPELWQTNVKPVLSTRTRSDRPGKDRDVYILPKFKWEPALIKCFWEQHKIPCPYSFQRAYVKTSSDRDCFIKIEARCSECGAEATGVILVEPQDNEAVPLKWSANDTRGIPHLKKRPLSHQEREAVGQALEGRSAASFRKDKAANSMNQSDVEPPYLYTKPVLRKCKQQHIDSLLHMDPKATSDPVHNLQLMKYSEPHAGSIHQIGMDPFFVHYHSPAQLHIFKKFVGKSYVVLAIDATGSLVQKLRTPSGRSSPHIFLYEGVIKAGTEQLPVCQMLSARQDANGIKFWLDELLRQGAPIPQEVVMDHSKALLNAAVVTFCGCYSLADYYERCIHALGSTEDDDETTDCLPKSFLRLDIAHLIGGAAKWRNWQDKSTRRLKLFYLQCLGLLALESCAQEFRDTFIQIGLAANCKYIDSRLTASIQKLINRIEGTPNDLKDQIIASEESEHSDSDTDPDEPDSETVQSESMEELCREVKHEIAKESARLNCGQTPNPYYCPDVLSRFLYLLPDFLLWSAVMVDTFQSPTLTGSSASVESDFSVVKQGILSGNKYLSRLDKFVARHLQSIEGSCRIAEAEDKLQSHLARLSSDDEDSKSDTQTIGKGTPKSTHPSSSAKRKRGAEDIDAETDQEKALNEMENWKGLSPPPPKKPKTSKYLSSNPELSLVLKSNSLQPPKERVLQNGFKMGFIKTTGALIHLSNTCSFDVLTQLITCAFIQYEEYRMNIETHLDGRKHHLIETCKSLALHGAVRETYLLRIEALSAITTPSTLVAPTRSGKTKKQDIPSYTYDCFSDLVDTARKLLPDLYSATVTSKCTQRTARRPCTPEDTQTIINADVEVLGREGLKGIDKAILVSLRMMGMEDENLPSSNVRTDITCAEPCTGLSTLHCKFGLHLIVNVDVFGSSSYLEGIETKNVIEDIPTKLKLLGKDFILSGMASRQSGHYIAYGRKANGQWESYNDLHKEVRAAKNTQQIEPVLVMYVPVTYK